MFADTTPFVGAAPSAPHISIVSSKIGTTDTAATSETQSTEVIEVLVRKQPLCIV